MISILFENFKISSVDRFWC